MSSPQKNVDLMHFVQICIILHHLWHFNNMEFDNSSIIRLHWKVCFDWWDSNTSLMCVGHVCVSHRIVVSILNRNRRKRKFYSLRAVLEKVAIQIFSLHLDFGLSFVSLLRDFIKNASGKYVTIKACQLGRLHPHRFWLASSAVLQYMSHIFFATCKSSGTR